MAGDRDTLDLHFPRGGVHRSAAFSRQPNVRVGRARDDYSRTTPTGVNVRVRDPVTLRRRGAVRAGLSKLVATRPGNVRYVTQELNVVVTTGAGMPQESQSGRVVTLVNVSQGEVWWWRPGDTDWTAATNSTGETPALNSSGLVYSSALTERLYFADGTNWCYFDPRASVVNAWVASAGALPIDADNNAPRLICTWRQRLVLAGLAKRPQDLYMSRVGDGTNFDYFPAAPSAADAFQGPCGDAITCLIPYSDDLLIVGMQGSIKVWRGDPKYGGQLDLVTSAIGMVWGQPWTMDPNGVVYFMSNRCEVHAFDPRVRGSQPVRVSGPIRSLLDAINTGEAGVRMAWDDRLGGLNVFVTDLTQPNEDDRHYTYELNEAGGGAWWQDVFAWKYHNPLCCCVLDGNLPEDRVVVIGSWDGFVRKIDPLAEDDDGHPINSEVWIGPFLTKYGDEVGLQEVQFVLAEDSGPVGWEVYVGQTAEGALESTAVASGTATAGRNFTEPVSRRGYAAYLRLVGKGVRWAMEFARAVVDTAGLTARRGR